MRPLSAAVALATVALFAVGLVNLGGVLAANGEEPVLRMFVDDAPFVRTTAVRVGFIERAEEAIVEYRLSNDGTAVDGVLVNGKPVPEFGLWALASGPDGPRTVHGQARYEGGSWSPILSQDLVRDTDPGSMMSVDLDPQGELAPISLPPGGDWHGVFALPTHPMRAATVPGETSPTGIQVHGGGWTVYFGDKENPIAPGTYAVPTPVDGVTTGSVYAGVGADGRGACGGGGTFTIHELELVAGDLAVLSADFRLICSSHYVMSGSVRYGNDAPIVALDPSIDKAFFGGANVGSATPEQTAAFTNSGAIATTLGNALIEGSHPGDFEITADTCSGKQLAVGDSCAVSIPAIPTARGPRFATLSIPDETPRKARRVVLGVSGSQPTTATLELESVPKFGPAKATAILTVYPAAEGTFNLWIDGESPWRAGPTTDRILENPSRREYRSPITLTPGKHELSAYFYGYDFYLDSVPPPVEVRVGTATRLDLTTVTDDGVAAGESADLIAALTAGSALNGGTLRIRDAATGEVLAWKVVSGSSDTLTHTVTRALGTHRFEAEFVPDSEDVQPAKTSYDLIVVSGTRPETTMDSTTLATNRFHSSTTFSSPDADVTFQCRYNLSNYWYTCSSPTELHTNREGTHTFSVRARRANGLADRTPASRKWIVDFIAPVGSVSIAGGAAYTKTTAVSVSVPATDNASGVSHVVLSNDGAMHPAQTYLSTVRWTLPSENGTATVWAQWRDAAGNWSDIKSDTIVLDTVAPTVRAPVATLLTSATLGAWAIPARLSWAGSDATSGIARYQLLQSVNGGAWSRLALPSATATSLDHWLGPGYAYRFALRGQDRAGNWSGWTYGPTLRVGAHQETSAAIAYTSGWTRGYVSGAYGSYVKHAAVAGPRARLTFTGRNVALVSNRAPNRGRAALYLDGAYVGTLDLYASTVQLRRIVYSRTFPSSGPHTLEVRPTGTRHPYSTGTRVDLDAFVVLQ